MFKTLVLSTLILLCMFLVSCSEQKPIKTDTEEELLIPEQVIEEEETVVINSRKNPAGINEAFIIDRETIFEKVSYKIELLEIISGEVANQMVREANPYNDKPKEDEEYILAKFKVNLIESKDDMAYSIEHHTFDAVSQNGKVYDQFLSVSGLQPNLATEIYTGAEHIGFTFFLVKKDDFPLIAHNRGTSAEVWFDLRAK